MGKQGSDLSWRPSRQVARRAATKIIPTPLGARSLARFATAPILDARAQAQGRGPRGSRRRRQRCCCSWRRNTRGCQTKRTNRPADRATITRSAASKDQLRPFELERRASEQVGRSLVGEKMSSNALRAFARTTTTTVAAATTTTRATVTATKIKSERRRTIGSRREAKRGKRALFGRLTR